jgi:hypothetical protein
VTTLVALALGYAGLTALCFGMEQHYRELSSALPARRTVVALRTAGSALLALALLVCIAGFPGSVGFIVWLGLLTAAALPLAFGLPFAPRAVAAAGACAPVAAAAFAFVGH